MLAALGRLVHFVDDYSFLFKVGLKTVQSNIEAYLKGLFQRYKSRNIERMVDVVEGDYQSIQQTISDSPWDHRPVMDLVAKNADKELGDAENACLILDPSAFRKWGNKSVGVRKQWCGRLGKVENCQVGIFAALAHGTQSTIIDSRLYLPDEWANDKERCLEAKVPEEEIKYRTRTDIALDMIDTADENKIRYGWILADAEFAKSMDFSAEIASLGKRFVIDIPKDTRIYLKKPSAGDEQGVAVESWASLLKKSEIKKYKIRNGTRGSVNYRVAHTLAWISDSYGNWWQWHVLFLQDEEGKRRYAISNAPAAAPVEKLAQIHSQRVWIESDFRDAKNAIGMDEYQVRGWIGWHHHMALCMMALLFCLTEKRRQKKTIIHLSAQDVTHCISMFLTSKISDKNEVFRQLRFRHQQRVNAIRSHARNKQRRLKEKCALRLSKLQKRAI